MDKKFIVNGTEIKVENYLFEEHTLSFQLNGKPFSYRLVDRHDNSLIIEHHERFKASVSSATDDQGCMVISAGIEAMVSASDSKIKKQSVPKGSLISPMPGKIYKIVKDIGAEVKKGDVILILEAMKMEHSIRSDKDGKVKKIIYKTGEMVQGGVSLAEVEE
jgi:3-methylcrotonyl-CoA carboxylase alpha subunit